MHIHLLFFFTESTLLIRPSVTIATYSNKHIVADVQEIVSLLSFLSESVPTMCRYLCPVYLCHVVSSTTGKTTVIMIDMSVGVIPCKRKQMNIKHRKCHEGRYLHMPKFGVFVCFYSQPQTHTHTHTLYTSL